MLPENRLHYFISRNHELEPMREYACLQIFPKDYKRALAEAEAARAAKEAKLAKLAKEAAEAKAELEV